MSKFEIHKIITYKYSVIAESQEEAEAKVYKKQHEPYDVVEGYPNLVEPSKPVTCAMGRVWNVEEEREV